DARGASPPALSATAEGSLPSAASRALAPAADGLDCGAPLVAGPAEAIAAMHSGAAAPLPSEPGFTSATSSPVFAAAAAPNSAPGDTGSFGWAGGTLSPADPRDGDTSIGFGRNRGTTGGLVVAMLSLLFPTMPRRATGGFGATRGRRFSDGGLM